MAWLSRVNFIASDTLSFSDINNLGNDIRAWGGNVNGGGYVLSNVVLSAFDLSTCFGLPISTGVSGLGTGVATFLATPSSANLAAALTDETGTGANVFATSPTLVTPTVTTSAVIPLVNGGTAVSSTLTLQSTSGAGTSDAIIFKTASQSERMRILSSGRVGINTSAPPNIFTVLDSGTLNTGGDTIDVGATVVGPSYAFGTGGNPANFNVHSNSTLGADVGATIGLGGRYTGTSFAQFAIIKGAKENATDGNYATYLAFGTRANGGVITERMRIKSDGFVGIGTASPGAKLSVEGGNIGIDGNNSAQQFFGAAGNVAGTNTTGGVITVFGHAPNAQTALSTPPFDGTSFVGAAGIITRGFSESSQYRGSLEFFTETSGTPASRMIITHDGNVGIGTPSPSWQTQVYGTGQNTALLTDAGSKSGSLFVGSSNGTTGAGGALLLGGVTANGVTSQWAIKSLITTTTANGTADLAFSTRALTSDTSLTERMRILSTGEVGIGTASPAHKLDVLGTSAKIYAGGTTTDTTLHIGNSDVALPGQGGFLIFHASAATPYLSINAISQGVANRNISLAPLGGSVGIGLTNPAYKLEISTDSAGKPGVGGLWTVVSDERIKADITPANLDRCYEIVKSVPLKHFGFAPGVYTDDQINDKHSLGWIAQDVQKVFSKAVSVKPFTLNTEIPDGTEEYTEQDCTLETVEKTETSIEVIDGKPVQVSKVVTSENKVLLFDSVDVVDEAGAVVMDGDKPLTYQMPRMVTKTRNKVRHDVIEDCLDLNGGQMIAALYGAVQALMLQVESLKARN